MHSPPEPEVFRPTVAGEGAAKSTEHVAADSHERSNQGDVHTDTNGREWFAEPVPGFIAPREPVGTKADGPSSSPDDKQNSAREPACIQVDEPDGKPLMSPGGKPLQRPGVWDRNSSVSDATPKEKISSEISPDGTEPRVPSIAWPADQPPTTHVQESSSARRESKITDWHKTIETRRVLRKEISGFENHHMQALDDPKGDSKASEASTIIGAAAKKKTPVKQRQPSGPTASKGDAIDAETVAAQLRQLYKRQAMRPSAPLQRKFEVTPLPSSPRPSGALAGC